MNPHQLVAWIVLLPLAGAIMNGLAGRFADKRLVSFVGVSSVLGSFFIASYVFYNLWIARGEQTNPAYGGELWEWFSISLPGASGERLVSIGVSFSFDSLSGLMCLMVTGIGSLIHIYSLGYMHDDPGYARFFAYLNLFMASMLILILASNMPLMFVGWEGVGLCSYLLIGFWWKNPTYAAAGRKAFVANRIGDFGVIIGMFILMSTAGSFEFTAINAAAPELQRQMTLGGFEVGTMATVACLFIFLGCTGKSAQVPLFVWLPDAMAGPTPVSALIHAATMVTAGVYLCCRLSDVFLQSPMALTVIAVIGTVTALIAASIAVVQQEMKKILAYSTVSQLGFMFAAVGVGAFTAGFFHVFTHAFFKACLFLGAGSVMHAVHAHGDADIMKLGGMKKFMPTTNITFFVSCLAIAGIPIFAGFFSKDEILLGAASVALGEGTVLNPTLGWIVLGGLAIAALLTAFYMFRLYYLTFTGEYRSAHAADHEGEHGDHDHHYAAEPHESETSMTFPLLVLGAGAVLAGLLGLPHVIPFTHIHIDELGVHHFWGDWLAPSVSTLVHAAHEGEGFLNPVNLAALTGLVVGFGGWLAARAFYKDAESDEITTKLPSSVRSFLWDKWRFDELYGATILRWNKALAVFSGRIDQSFVDTLLTKATSKAVEIGSWIFTRIQVGVVHAYALVLVLGLLGVSWWFLYPHVDVEVEATSNSASFSVGRGFGYEYRYDLDGDGNFDIPPQPQHVTIDLADDINDAAVGRVVALVRAALAPNQTPADRSVLGRLIDPVRKIYEMHPPVSELSDLRQALERAENIDAVHFAPMEHEVAFANAANAQRAYTSDDWGDCTPSDRSYCAVLISDRRGEVTHIPIGTSPTRLDDGELGPRWERIEEPSELPPLDCESDEQCPETAECGSRSCVNGTCQYATDDSVCEEPGLECDVVHGCVSYDAPVIFVDAEGHVVLRPNNAVVRQGGQARVEEFWIEPGQSALVGRTSIHIAPVVRAAVEVRNAFGNVARDTVDVTLFDPPSPTPAQAALHVHGREEAVQ